MFVGNCGGAVFEDFVEFLGFGRAKKAVDLLYGVVVREIAGVRGDEYQFVFRCFWWWGWSLKLCVVQAAFDDVFWIFAIVKVFYFFNFILFQKIIGMFY